MREKIMKIFIYDGVRDYTDFPEKMDKILSVVREELESRFDDGSAYYTENIKMIIDSTLK